MPYKDPEKRKAYHKAYMEGYQSKWREKHPNYNKDYLRHWRADNPGSEKRTLEENNERQKRYYRNNRLKANARNKLRYAVKVGKIVKPTRCEMCREEKTLQADHHNYSKPYDVLWLCRICHLELTVKRLRLGVDL